MTISLSINSIFVNHAIDRMILPVLILTIQILGSGCVASEEIAGPTETPADFSLTFYNVGQGDACLLQSAGKAILIDAGPPEAGPVIADWIKKHNISSLETVIASHPHSDHIGGIPSILKHIKVGQVIDNGDIHNTPTYTNYLSAIEKSHVPLRTAQKGDIISFVPGLMIEVLHPGKELGDDINDNSLVLKITSGQTTALLMGDAGKMVEEKIISEGTQIKADILKVGHHGSRHSSGKAFISRVNPEIAIISLGPDNEYGYPQKDPITYLSATGAWIYRTDQEGTISIICNESGRSVITGDEIRDLTACDCPSIHNFCSEKAGRLNPCCAACRS